jgi:hypothetical protein
MIAPSQLALKTHTNFGCAASFATLDTLVERFPLPSVSPPIGDTSLTHVMRFAAHSTTSPIRTAMGQSFIITLYNNNTVRSTITWIGGGYDLTVSDFSANTRQTTVTIKF